MKYLTLLLFITTFISCTYTQNSKSKQLDETYKGSHTFGDCPRPLGFSKNTKSRAWAYPGSNWKLAKVDVKSFDEINDSLLLNADFDAMFEEVSKRGKPMKNLNVGIGEFVIAKHTSRVNDYYVFEFIDQIGEKVKLDHKTYRIKSKPFYKLDDIEKLNYCIEQSDLRTLEELVTEDRVNINTCAVYKNSERIPLTFTLAIDKKNREVFDKLIELGADINQPCRGNRTALMRASRGSDMYYFKKLVELGADISIKDKRGKTVHDYIKNSGNFDLLELID